MPTILEIADTAVKIGLGALISALGGLALAKLNHASDKDKKLYERRLQKIEQAAEDFVRHLTALQRLVATLDGVRGRHADEAVDFSDERHKLEWDGIVKRDSELCDQRESLLKATAALELLGLSEEGKIADRLWALENKVRRAAMFDRKLPAKDQLSEWQRAAVKIREDYFASISAHYKA